MRVACAQAVQQANLGGKASQAETLRAMVDQFQDSVFAYQEQQGEPVGSRGKVQVRAPPRGGGTCVVGEHIRRRAPA